MLQQLTPPVTSLRDFEEFSHEQELDGLRHLSLSVLEHMSFEREALRRAARGTTSSTCCRGRRISNAHTLGAASAFRC